jgi:hypothetical protein
MALRSHCLFGQQPLNIGQIGSRATTFRFSHSESFRSKMSNVRTDPLTMLSIVRAAAWRVSDRPTFLPLGPSCDILFQNAFDLSDRFWIRH